MLPKVFLLTCLTILRARAQQASSDDFSYTQMISTISGGIPTSAFTDSQYTYLSPQGQSTLSTSTASRASSNLTATTSTSTFTSSSDTQITLQTTSESLTVIGGVTATSSDTTTNITITSTSSSATPTNTASCNGYPEFCTRKYSNITEVCAHNSAFVVKNNAASNQAFPVIDQLNDGIRILQGETQWVNDTVYNCHTSCELLNAGTWESYLTTVRKWLQAHPYDVVTFFIANSDLTTVENYVPAITNAGLLPYVYTPSYVPQYRDQWPTLGEMILRNQRMVFFMDYNANQTAVPYILDQYTHVWETPFSPQNQSFPCIVGRPPNLNETKAREEYMYLANHNLNTAVDIGAILGTGAETILIPNTAELNITNGQANQFGRLGATRTNCTEQWGRPPNFLVVDYYNIGSPESGSVFHVAADANGVTYNRPCCGVTPSAAPLTRASSFAFVVAVILTVVFVW